METKYGNLSVTVGILPQGATGRNPRIALLEKAIRSCTDPKRLLILYQEMRTTPPFIY